MEQRPLGCSELQVSAIGLGAATFGREIDESSALAVMDYALERGITLFDTAEAYSAGRSEEIVGRWIASRGVRERIVLTTKVAPPLAPERVIASAEASLRRLQTEVIDLFLLHSWDPNTPLEATLEALSTLIQSGKVRAIGCSNFAAWQLCKALWKQEVYDWGRMAAIQPVYNLAMRGIESELLPLCADQQIGVISYSPLGAGFLTGKYAKGAAVPHGTRFEIVPGHQGIYFHDAAFTTMERLRSTANQAHIPMARLGLAWVLSRPHISSTLVGARSLAQIDQAFDALMLAQNAAIAPVFQQLEAE